MNNNTITHGIAFKGLRFSVIITNINPRIVIAYNIKSIVPKSVCSCMNKNIPISIKANKDRK